MNSRMVTSSSTIFSSSPLTEPGKREEIHCRRIAKRVLPSKKRRSDGFFLLFFLFVIALFLFVCYCVPALQLNSRIGSVAFSFGSLVRLASLRKTTVFLSALVQQARVSFPSSPKATCWSLFTSLDGVRHLGRTCVVAAALEPLGQRLERRVISLSSVVSFSISQCPEKSTWPPLPPPPPPPLLPP